MAESGSQPQVATILATVPNSIAGASYPFSLPQAQNPDARPASTLAAIFGTIWSTEAVNLYPAIGPITAEIVGPNESQAEPGWEILTVADAFVTLLQDPATSDSSFRQEMIEYMARGFPILSKYPPLDHLLRRFRCRLDEFTSVFPGGYAEACDEAWSWSIR